MACEHGIEKIIKLDVYESIGLGVSAEGVNCGVVKWVKHGTLRWFGRDRNEWGCLSVHEKD